ncbi:leucine-rich repeat-containing protein 15-like [Schistocerca serialis cubense]|uniref:leucine-rich repeat-containing protein 15-like n=1 Tax=Schistocerca serialis cubense TaxID=2023355 RepID=UPI00214EC970|nr:leucine-rich repeat-containing protein 15-like [Schistocerca serialis cubense]XP_049950196.1 leucine-rich repeat-containing protein 15-like [Schistocerca serialis cubense]XP_049950203.1 leucine-rich repeat-containing protein 15-like [Schistocerca serialis cubense]
MLMLDMSFKLLLVSLATMRELASGEGGVGPACPCEPQGHLATCSFMDLTRVPACLPGEAVTQLYLDHNSIQELTADQLRPFSLLRFLSAEGNLITDLPQDLFRYTPRLREIYLSENRIKSVSPTTFLPVANLQKLVLSENHLSSLPPKIFSGLPKLLELDLSGNQLTSVPADAFPRSLRLLRLHKNQLESLPAAWPVALEELDLSDNMLRRADAAALDRLPALRELRLEGNPWHCACDATGDLAALVARRNFLEDMEDPMVCASPPDIRDSQLLHVLRYCYIDPSATGVSATSPTLLGRVPTSIRETSARPSAAAANSSVTPATVTNTTDVPLNPAYNHAQDTLAFSFILLVSICLSVVAVILIRKIYVLCREKRFCVRHDGEKLTSEDEESVV